MTHISYFLEENNSENKLTGARALLLLRHWSVSGKTCFPQGSTVVSLFSESFSPGERELGPQARKLSNAIENTGSILGFKVVIVDKCNCYTYISRVKLLLFFLIHSLGTGSLMLAFHMCLQFQNLKPVSIQRV